MPVPTKIETTLRNLTLTNWAQDAGGTIRNCNGGRCFLEQYALDHIPNSYHPTQEGGIYIDWCTCREDPHIEDLACRINPNIKDKTDIEERQSNILAAIYRINDDRALNLDQVKEKIRSFYN